MCVCLWGGGGSMKAALLKLKWVPRCGTLSVHAGGGPWVQLPQYELTVYRRPTDSVLALDKYRH